MGTVPTAGPVSGQYEPALYVQYEKLTDNATGPELLRSVVNEFRTLRIEQSEGFKRLIDNECSVRHSSYCTDIDDNEDGWIINDEEEEFV